MKKISKKLLAVLLVIAMLIPTGVMTITSSAATYSGNCGADGDNVTWSLDTSTGVLTISGSGNMKDYSGSNSPWYSYKTYIKSAVITAGITHISNNAFFNCKNLTSVSIPDSVISIGNCSFESCTNLTSIVIPVGVTNISNGAFYGCTNLASVVIPANVTSIGSSAFYGCTSLTSVAIPNSVTSIGTAAFSGCTALTSIAVDENNINYCSENGVVYNKAKTALLIYPAGKDTAIITESITSIGDYAFSGCSKLTRVEIPNSVKSIGNYVFYNCTGLTSVEMPNSVKSIGDYAFAHCTKLESFEMPNSVTSIGTGAFYNCSKLIRIEIPNSIKSINANTFDGCKGLTSVEIPNSVTSIGNDAFDSCSKLASIVIPDSVTSIGGYAFADCTNLKTVVLGKNIKTVGSCAFHSNQVQGMFGGYWPFSVENVYYTGDIASWCNIDWQTRSGFSSGAVPSCPYITNLYIDGKLSTNLVLPEGLTKINPYAFYSVKSIKSVTIPKSVTSIGSNAFYRTTPQTVYYEGTVADWCNISISGGIGTYHSYLGANPVKSSTEFYINGEKVEELVIPDGVTTIKSMTFCDVDCIKAIYIPKSVKTIQSCAFYNCSNITDICYEGSEADWKAISKGNHNDILSTATIHYEEDADRFPYYDTDDDGLPDKWETEGVDTDGDGIIDLDLPAMGADPDVPDIFVEVDWMVHPYEVEIGFWTIGLERNLKPSEKAMRMVYDVFKEHGINLHVDCGPDSTDFVTGEKWGDLSGGNEVDYVRDFNLGENWENWESTISLNFATNRRQVFRHCLFAYQYNGTTSSGIANGIPGQYFIVANQGWVYQGGNISVAGTFMHELGHTLGLCHGGCDHEHYKPNYLSIMNYAFQTTGLAGTGDINYSDYELPDIDESAIDETKGIDPDGLTEGTGLKTTLFYKTDLQRNTGKIANAKIDFNGNKTIDSSTYTLDLNPGGNVYDSAISVLKGGFNDWKHLVYKGGSIGELSGESSGNDFSIIIDDASVIIEKTLEESLRTSTLATKGTGYIEPVATTIIKDIKNQKLYFDISNMGAEEATYTVTIKCDELFAEYNADVFVNGSTEQVEKTRISIPVNSDVDSGEYTVCCTLSYPEKEDIELSFNITVYEPTEDELNQVKNELAGNKDFTDNDILKEIKNVLTQTVGYEEESNDKDNIKNCSHLCHSKNGFMQFIWKIVKFIYRIFGTNQYCDCGMAHW